MAPFTSADVTSAQGRYLAASADPSLVPGLDFDLGTLVVFGTDFYQKTGPSPTAWTKRSGSGGGGGGGGSAGAPVVNANPVGPVLNQQWILHTPAVPALGLQSGPQQVPGMNGFANFNVNTNDPTSLQAFSSNPGSSAGPWGIFIQVGPPGPPDSVQGNSPFGLFVQLSDPTRTLSQINALINNWAIANHPAIPQPLASLTDPASDGNIQIGMFGGKLSIPLTSGGTPESYVYKIQGTSKIFSLPLA